MLPGSDAVRMNVQALCNLTIHQSFLFETMSVNRTG